LVEYVVRPLVSSDAELLSGFFRIKINLSCPCYHPLLRLIFFMCNGCYPSGVLLFFSTFVFRLWPDPSSSAPGGPNLFPSNHWSAAPAALPKVPPFSARKLRLSPGCLFFVFDSTVAMNVGVRAFRRAFLCWKSAFLHAVASLARFFSVTLYYGGRPLPPPPGVVRFISPVVFCFCVLSHLYAPCPSRLVRVVPDDFQFLPALSGALSGVCRAAVRPGIYLVLCFWFRFHSTSLFPTC